MKMNKYVKLTLALFAFVVFLIGIYFLYDKLAEEYNPQQNLMVESAGSNKQSEEGRDSQESDAMSDLVEKKEENVDEGTDNSEELSNSETDEVDESVDTGMPEGENSNDNTGTSEEEPSNLAIDFTMEDAAGEEVALYDYIGKPMVLNFWASWCRPCKAEIPDFQEAFEKYDGEIAFLMVNMTDGVQETKESAVSFIEEQGYTLPFYFDTQLQGAYTYGVYSLPMTFFIDADGEMIAYAQGMIDRETLETGISMIYDGE